MVKVFNNSVSGEAAVIATTVNEMENLVKSFNEMMKEQVRDDFEDAVITLEDVIAEEGEEDTSVYYFSMFFDFGYDYEEEWRKFAWEQGKVELSVAVEFYRENVKKFINEDTMSKYVDKLFDDYSDYYDIDQNSFNNTDCKVCMFNPYYDGYEDIEREV
jgi:hypothetical protein